MNLKTKIMKILLLILLLIFIFGTFLTNVICAENSIGDYTSWKSLQYAAADGDDAYFAGSTKDLMSKKRVFKNTKGTDMGVFHPGDVCIAPGNHANPEWLQPTCVMDIDEDGTVTTSWLNSNKMITRTIKYNSGDTEAEKEKRNQALEVAYIYCYFSYMARNEKTPYPSGSCGTYQEQIRKINASTYFTEYMHGVFGVPLYFCSSFEGQVKGTNTINKLSEAKKAISEKQYYGRLVFLKGKPSNGSFQHYNDNKYSTKWVDGQCNLIYGAKTMDNKSITIKKVEAGNEQVTLKGAEYNIYHIKSNNQEELIAKNVTTNQSGIYKFTDKTKLTIGDKYRVEEVKAPTGYFLPDSPSQTFTLDTYNKEVTFKDVKKPIIKIYKKDSKDGSALKGAKFGIYPTSECKQEDRIVGGTTNDSGEITIKNAEGKLKVNETYYIKEEKAPDGYIKADPDTAKIGPLVSGDNTVTFENTKIPKIKIYKKDSEDGSALLGAKFGIYPTSECKKEERIGGGTTNEQGELVIQNSKFELEKEYWVKEEKAPDGYIKADPDTAKIGPLQPGENQKNNVILKNTKIPKIKIYKRDEDTDELLPGAEFGIYPTSECKQEERIGGGTTNAQGVLLIENEDNKFKLEQEYWVKEEKEPAGYAMADPNIQKIGKLKPGDGKDGSNEVTFKNKKITFSIVKVEEGKEFHRVQGAHFKVYSDAALTNLVIEGTTDENGEIIIKEGLKEGKKYYIQETQAPTGYKINETIVEVTLQKGANIIKMTDPKLPDYIYKYAKDTNLQYPVANVTIGYKNWTPDNENYTHAPQDSDKPKDKSEYETEENYQRAVDAYNDWVDAYNHYMNSRGKDEQGKDKYIAIGVTDDEGKVEIDGSKLREDGTYEIWEIESGNKYFQIDGPVQKIGGQEGHKPYAKEKEYIENPRTHEDIEGWVWVEDVPKNEQPNNIKAGDEGERLVNGALVELKTKDGQIVLAEDGTEMKMVTGSMPDKGDGYYRFDLLEVSKIENDEYKIEITYNGLLYKSIPVKDLEARIPDVTGSSKLSDIPAKREEINKKYSTITKNSKKQNENDSDGILYDTTTDYESRRICDTTYQGLTDEGAACVQSTTTGFNITADTETSGYKLKNSYNPAYDCITNINLGLSRIEEPNLILEKDLATVTVTINGEEHIYQYGDKDKILLEEFLKSGDIQQPENENDVASIYDLEPKVRMGEKYGSLSYTRALAASDIKYNDDEYGDVPKDKELEVTATYKIGICNDSLSRKMRVNELIEYCDEKYDPTTIEVFRKAEDGSEQAIEATAEGTVSSTTRARQYNKLRIKNLNMEIEPKTGGNIDKTIYVRAKVRKDKIIELIDKNEENNGTVEMDNFAEIASYTTMELDGTEVAGIDINSQPENLEIDNTKTYEDDSNKAPDFKLVLQEARTISGTVFIDKSLNSENEVVTGEVREGDGTFNEGEVGLAEVPIKLYINRYTNTNGNNKDENMWQKEIGEWEQAKRYNQTTGGPGTWINAEAKTDSNGNFSITGLIPGDYKLVYTWGGQTYELNGNSEKVRVQDYKATIVNEQVHTLKENAENKNKWYKNEFKQANGEWEGDPATGKEIRKSDATDDYNKRKLIDDQSSIMTYYNKEIIKEQDTTKELEVKEAPISNTLITQMDSITPLFNIGVEYYDNGKAPAVADEYETDADGNLVPEDGICAFKKKEPYRNHLKSIDLGITQRAKQKIELHKEIKNVKSLSATGNILAEANRNNTLEEMTTNNGFRYFKEEKGIIGSGTLEYEVDNEIVQSAQLAVQYEFTITNVGEVEYQTEQFYKYGNACSNEYKTNIVQLNAQGIIDYIDNGVRTGMDYDEWKIFAKDQYRDNLYNPDEIQKQLLTPDIETYLTTKENVLLKDDLSREEAKWLDPINNKQTKEYLECSRLLPNTDDDVSFANDAELIRIEKRGGATLVTTPGNYIPTNSDTGESDNDTSEEITVTSPSGGNKNYITTGLLAISSLAVLAAGVIIIKKYVISK